MGGCRYRAPFFRWRLVSGIACVFRGSGGAVFVVCFLDIFGLVT